MQKIIKNSVKYKLRLATIAAYCRCIFNYQQPQLAANVGILSLFFLNWQGISSRGCSQTRETIHARGKRHPCPSTVCEKTIPLIPISHKVRKIAGITANYNKLSLILLIAIIITNPLKLYATALIKEPVQICVIPNKVYLTNNLRAQIARCLGWQQDDRKISLAFCSGYYKPFAIAYSKKNEVRINSNEVSFFTQGRSVLTGGVEVTQNERMVSANTAYVYRDAHTNKITKIELIGEVHYVESDKIMIAQRILLNMQEHSGTVENAIYRFNFNLRHVNLPAWGRADLIQRFTNKNYLLQNVSYTTCPPLNHSWQINAESISIDNATSSGVARNAKLRIGDLPILYTPYLSFPTNKKRKTGFLMPIFGVSNIGGFDYIQPYYLNLAPNYDATLLPHLYTRRGVMLGGQFRYLTPSAGGMFNGHFLPLDHAFEEFLQSNQQKYPILINNSTNRWAWQFIEHREILPNLSLGISLQKVSDNYYLQDFSSNFVVLTERQLLRQIDLTYTSSHWLLRGMLQNYQTLNPVNDTKIAGVYQRLPQLLAQGNYTGLPLNGDFAVTGQFDQFILGKNMSTFEGPRYYLNPILSLAQRQPWGYLTPAVQLVANYYEINHTWLPNNEHFNRIIPRYNLDAGLFLERDIKFLSSVFTQTLEPRLFYLYVPYHNQTAIPVYDAGYMIFNTDQLFRGNRFSGMDRIGDANQLTYALTSRWISNLNGQEKANISLGQIRYFANRRVMLCQSNSGSCQDNPLTLGYLPPTAKYSPFAAHGEYKVNSLWSITADYIWDSHGTNNGNTQFNYQENLNQIIRLGYSYLANGDITKVANSNQQNNPLHQISVAIAWPLGGNLSTLGAYNYNISKRYEMMSFFGIQYDNCCWAIRFLANRAFQSLNNAARPQYENNFYIQILLKGLGSAGNNDPASTITTALPGYIDSFHR